MHDQAATHDVGGAGAHANAARLEVEGGHAAAVRAQAGQVAGVVRSLAVLAVRCARGIEVAARAVAVPAGAVAFFMDVKAVLRPRLEPADRAADAHRITVLHEAHRALGAVAARRLQPCGGRGRAGHGCAAGECDGSRQGRARGEVAKGHAISPGGLKTAKLTRFARQRNQTRERSVVDAHALQLGVRGLGVVARGAVDAAGLREDAAIFLVRQHTRVAGALARQRESQRAHRTLGRAAVEPARVVYAQDHLALPQVDHDLARVAVVHAEHHAAATAARQHAEHQARAFGRAAIHAAPHLQSPVPAVHRGRAPLGVGKVGPPDQRAIAKDPQVVPPAPFMQRAVEHGGGVTQGSGKRRHGETLQSMGFVQRTDYSREFSTCPSTAPTTTASNASHSGSSLR